MQAADNLQDFFSKMDAIGEANRTAKDYLDKVDPIYWVTKRKIIERRDTYIAMAGKFRAG